MGFAQLLLETIVGKGDSTPHQRNVLDEPKYSELRAQFGTPSSGAQWRYVHSRIEISHEEALLVREVEFRLVSSEKKTKSIVVGGETYTREDTETEFSDWRPAKPENISLFVSEKDVLVFS